MDEQTEITNTQQVDNEDVSALDTQKAYYEEILSQKDAKYRTLLQAYARGERAEASAPSEPTPDELKAEFEKNVLLLHDNKASDLDQAKAIMSIREYRLNLGEPDIFLPQDGVPSAEDIDSARKLGDLLSYAIEDSDGSDGRFRATIQDHLVDNKNIRIR